MIYITTFTVKMLLNIALSPDEYFLLIWVLYLSHARYRSWPCIKGPVCAFTLVFQKFAGLLLASIISHLSNATGIDNMECEGCISLIFAVTPNEKNQSKSHYLSMVTFVLRFDNINGNKAMEMDKRCVDLWKPAPVQRKRCNITHNYYCSSFPMKIIITTPSRRIWAIP